MNIRVSGVVLVGTVLVWVGATSSQPVSEPADLVLDGVIVAENPADSIALVRRAGAKRGRPLRLGQEYGGYVLVEVTRGSVLMKGRFETLRLTLPGGPSRTSVERHEEPKTRVPDLVWERRAFSRAHAHQRLEKEIPVILSDTELTPKVVEGEVQGLELIRLPDGTVLSESGLLPGDVLKSINGEPLHGVDSLWTLLARFADVDELRVIVERKGKVVRLAYALTN